MPAGPLIVHENSAGPNGVFKRGKSLYGDYRASSYSTRMNSRKNGLPLDQ